MEEDRRAGQSHEDRLEQPVDDGIAGGEAPADWRALPVGAGCVAGRRYDQSGGQSGGPLGARYALTEKNPLTFSHSSW